MILDGRRFPLNSRRQLYPFNGSLTIDPLDKSSDAGLYSCEARGQNGLTARQSLQLNILGKFQPHGTLCNEINLIISHYSTTRLDYKTHKNSRGRKCYSKKFSRENIIDPVLGNV